MDKHSSYLDLDLTKQRTSPTGCHRLPGRDRWRILKGLFGSGDDGGWRRCYDVSKLLTTHYFSIEVVAQHTPSYTPS